MSSFRLRPRFKHFTNLSPAEIENMVKEEKVENGTGYEINMLAGHVSFKVPIKKRNFWSPELTLSIEEGEDKTVIRGFYGPNPTTWALFTYGYVILGILSLFVGMWALAKITLNKPAPELWLLLVFVLLASVLYVVAQFGQKLGAEQMYKLHFFYESVLGEKFKIK